ncbi:FeoB small GTPase domain-containing protein [Thermosyntropha sp.]|uniref:FeoB small GTPase domain-containing protein n=1 Tax=Thermosyntropha sp. TaxID=2740820 RepID=UPI0025FEF89A|nr:FeoB small GTPase domain-containing protein [Thermosyntropha sp.]MBO8158924.1 50S ribosome-binding GTPase [Thermosyntropha sp.]
MNFEELVKVRKKFNVEISSPDEVVVALAGNPNTGKSTIFNNLTGMKQHTGNWPGKTVVQAQGEFIFEGRRYKLIDLPGTYSLFANSSDEQVARDFICFGCPDVTVVVTDGTCLERNLNLVLQILEITDKVIVCVNLIDEAKRKSLYVDTRRLSCELGVPVLATAARAKKGLDELKILIKDMVEGRIKTFPCLVRYDTEIELLVEKIQSQLMQLPVSRFINPRWVALRIIDGDKGLWEGINQYWTEESSVIL